MYHILILEGKAHQSIPEFDPAFPGVPIEERYSLDILSKCVKSDAAIPDGWLYDSETQAFSEPPEPEPLPEIEPAPVIPEPMERIAAALEFNNLLNM